MKNQFCFQEKKIDNIILLIIFYKLEMGRRRDIKISKLHMKRLKSVA